MPINFDPKEILRCILEKAIQGIVVSWIFLGSLASFVLVYLSLRLAFVIIRALEEGLRGL